MEISTQVVQSSRAVRLPCAKEHKRWASELTLTTAFVDASVAISHPQLLHSVGIKNDCNLNLNANNKSMYLLYKINS